MLVYQRVYIHVLRYVLNLIVSRWLQSPLRALCASSCDLLEHHHLRAVNMIKQTVYIPTVSNCNILYIYMYISYSIILYEFICLLLPLISSPNMIQAKETPDGIIWTCLESSHPVNVKYPIDFDCLSHRFVWKIAYP